MKQIRCKNNEEAGHMKNIFEVIRYHPLWDGIERGEFESMFRWHEKIENSTECLLRSLTVERNLRNAMQCIREIHSYEVPVITAREIHRSDYRTLKWVVDNCGDE